jgi:dipeptidyl aminopeptidase/acylaminoacyl peptidase
MLGTRFDVRTAAWAALVLAAATSMPVFAEPVTRQIGQMVLEDVPPADEALRARLAQFLEIRSASLSDISADGRTILISTRFGNAAQLHLVSTPMGARKQITFFEEPVRGGSFIPGTNEKHILFGKDRGGDEKINYYRLDLNTGRSTLLTDGKSRHSRAAMSHDGKLLAVTGTARNEKDFDLYLKDLTSDAPPKLVWQVEGQYYATEFSPDNSQLIVMQYLSERETRYYLFDVASGQHRPLTPTEPAAYYGDATWSHDGKSIFLTTDREGEFRRLYRYDLATQQMTCLTPELNWDVEAIAVDPRGTGMAYVVNEDGISRLYLVSGDSGATREVTGLPVGVIGGVGFNRNGGTLALTVNSARSPADGYTVNFETGQATRWTESEIGGLNPDHFVEPELIRYETFDKVDGKPRLIPAFYYRGKGEGKRPVVIQCHGGPESQTLPTFSSTIQFWATELGISVICPNVRGSTGYGRTFHQLDNGVLREDAVKDIGGLLDWIAQQPELDAERVGIYGGSYGGYMVLGSLVNFPDRFKAGIDVVGVANFITFLETTPIFRRDLRRAEYGDERDPEVRKVLERISPTNNAEKIKAALFVLHGQNDPRVPVSEAKLVVSKMRELGRTVWFANALNEGHGFAKRENSDLAALFYAQFWREHLLK